MQSHPLHEARAALSRLVDRALAGEPQRITRHGKEAVVIVSEADWNARPKSAPTLADLFVGTIGAEPDVADVVGAERPWSETRALGADFAD
ncbi:type II toxin-antitoxin system Phd/YefM family antitoxin [Prosthecomicrobium hirschii]|jgi:prevent-host-death family protein|uniref:type II toxin-antitoxin system Phd/YefM family antitoxin n=1 Tax=Prosthecodimorpha hirschii TaxID=665126 RepID=UPI0009F8BF7F|nr:type II toxin-antitoxin system Phd/YefM family antitoxin [Prosthecomicrobium hirschii]MCW1840682.1 type II toxin-antitoxin system Phd/YefM family antitoxin [Prosthecomicrobium hirschii]TPQ49518.1 type II toxin-antitoxin system Phd/YefM family antitoxin [Prosthecomicrobium hirschii]